VEEEEEDEEEEDEKEEEKTEEPHNKGKQPEAMDDIININEGAEEDGINIINVETINYIRGGGRRRRKRRRRGRRKVVQLSR
jgi:CO dehydrogenase/acetyl-CoA synthase beta subunit